ncbi:hypothetical protein GGS24DRAFT_323304 [Hypoxylon argillaceum]|nr:hypothetical protein GGS24DRAFT_323304 [Hypoxylon argillaceum]KAI1155875.1 hypothetical protein F4825DRAFT_383940 [Nemania diffusa]
MFHLSSRHPKPGVVSLPFCWFKELVGLVLALVLERGSGGVLGVCLWVLPRGGEDTHRNTGADQLDNTVICLALGGDLD